jgi:hypothetical protein
MEAHGPITRRGSSLPPDSRAGFDPARNLSSKPVASLPAGAARVFSATGTDPAMALANDTPRTIELSLRGRGSLLKDIVGLIGIEDAARLIAAYGGMRLYVPHAPEPDDTLSQTVGHGSAVLLAQVYGGDRLDVPNPTPRRFRIIELRASGVSIDVIARSLRCTRRRVFQVLAEARRDRHEHHSRHDQKHPEDQKDREDQKNRDDHQDRNGR